MEAATLNCPMCGAPSSSEATLCDHCGARLATIACPSCFGMVFLGSKFCQHCGGKIERTDETADVSKKCPRCKEELRPVTLGTTQVSECLHCEGLWVDTATFNEICADREKQTAVIGIPGDGMPHELTLETVRYVPCPVCQTLMNRLNFAHASGIIVDICKDHGIWFDRDELRGIVEFIRTGGLEKARERDRQIWEGEKRTRDLARSVAVNPASPGESVFNESVSNVNTAADVIAFIVRLGLDLLK